MPTSTFSHTPHDNFTHQENSGEEEPQCLHSVPFQGLGEIEGRESGRRYTYTRNLEKVGVPLQLPHIGLSSRKGLSEANEKQYEDMDEGSPLAICICLWCLS